MLFPWPFLRLASSASSPPPPSGGGSSLRDSLPALLLGDATLAALVVDRVRPGSLSILDSYPGIRFVVISNKRVQGLRGPTDQWFARVEFSVVSDDAAVANQVDLALFARLNAYRGSIGKFSLQQARLIGESDQSELPIDGSDSWLYLIRSEFYLKYSLTS